MKHRFFSLILLLMLLFLAPVLAEPVDSSIFSAHFPAYTLDTATQQDNRIYALMSTPDNTTVFVGGVQSSDGAWLFIQSTPLPAGSTLSADGLLTVGSSGIPIRVAPFADGTWGVTEIGSGSAAFSLGKNYITVTTPLDGYLGDHPWSDITLIDWSSLPPTFEEALSSINVARWGVISVASASLYSSYSTHSDIIGTFKQGTPFFLREFREDYVRIVIGDHEGWLPRASVALNLDANAIAPLTPYELPANSDFYAAPTANPITLTESVSCIYVLGTHTESGLSYIWIPESNAYGYVRNVSLPAYSASAISSDTVAPAVTATPAAAIAVPTATVAPTGVPTAVATATPTTAVSPDPLFNTDADPTAPLSDAVLALIASEFPGYTLLDSAILYASNQPTYTKHDFGYKGDSIYLLMQSPAAETVFIGGTVSADGVWSFVESVPLPAGATMRAVASSCYLSFSLSQGNFVVYVQPFADGTWGLQQIHFNGKPVVSFEQFIVRNPVDYIDYTIRNHNWNNLTTINWTTLPTSFYAALPNPFPQASAVLDCRPYDDFTMSHTDNKYKIFSGVPVYLRESSDNHYSVVFGTFNSIGAPAADVSGQYIVTGDDVALTPCRMPEGYLLHETTLLHDLPDVYAHAIEYTGQQTLFVIAYPTDGWAYVILEESSAYGYILLEDFALYGDVVDQNFLTESPASTNAYVNGVISLSDYDPQLSGYTVTTRKRDGNYLFFLLRSTTTNDRVFIGGVLQPDGSCQYSDPSSPLPPGTFFGGSLRYPTALYISSSPFAKHIVVVRPYTGNTWGIVYIECVNYPRNALSMGVNYIHDVLGANESYTGRHLWQDITSIDWYHLPESTFQAIQQIENR